MARRQVFLTMEQIETVGAFSMRCLKIVVCDISCAVDDIPTETWHLDCVLQPSVHPFTDCNWVHPCCFLRMLSMPVSNSFVRWASWRAFSGIPDYGMLFEVVILQVVGHCRMNSHLCLIEESTCTLYFVQKDTTIIFWVVHHNDCFRWMDCGNWSSHLGTLGKCVNCMCTLSCHFEDFPGIPCLCSVPKWDTRWLRAKELKGSPNSQAVPKIVFHKIWHCLVPHWLRFLLFLQYSFAWLVWQSWIYQMLWDSQKFRTKENQWQPDFTSSP